ncbi:MAG: hypothetical protein KDM91_01335, partial [Verrucomicrobiae bacterium]|nr:hypothetical protein [Verrucomicrobiae bacterium]
MPDPTPHFRDAAEVERIANGEHGDPFSVLGAHACPESGEWIVRAMRPGAEQLWILLDDGR